MKRRSFFQRVQDLPKPTRILRRVVEVFAGHAIYLCLLSALLLQPVLPLLASRAEAATLRTPSTPGRATAPPLQSTVYGPVRFDRQAGTAENVIRQFSVPGPLAASYMLRIENGTSGAANRATGVIMLLNGTLLTTSRLVDNGVAALDIPVQLLSNNELSIRVTGAPGSYVTVSIFIPSNLSITTFSPTSGYPGATVTISGTGFKPDAPNQNVAYFTASGGGFVFAPVTAYTSTSLTVTVPADAATGPVKVQTPDGSVVSAQSFTIVSGPYISGFTPTSGPIGATVTITGTNLKPDSSAPAVTFTGSNNTRIPALVSSSTATQVLVPVPNGVITGPIELTTSAGKTTSTSVFSVQASQDFAITLAPATAMALQGGQATFLLTLTSDDPNFTQLATLSAPSLPSGIKASFNPAQITAGGSSTVTMVIPGNISSGSYDFTFEAKALVDGSEKSKTTNGSVTVNIAAQTTLSGRVLANDSVPIVGATVSIDGLTAVTDSAGNFLLSGLTAGTERPLMVDGRTAYAPNRSYPVIAEPVTIVTGQANVVPYTFYLPVVDTASEVQIVPSVTTNVTTPQVPGLTMTIPANAGLVNRDGTPVTRASITPVEIDRTPAPLPPNVGTSIVFTAQPGGARPAQGMNVPVTYPNLGGANPGTRIALWNFNHNTVQWYIYGYGIVSSNGRFIVPEPGVGLPDFSWHFPAINSPCDGGRCCIPQPGTCSFCPAQPDPLKASNPVDFSSGLKIEKATDVSFSSSRGGITLTRIYTSNLAGLCDDCIFGRGWTHNYGIYLTGLFDIGGSGRVIWPEESIGRLFNFQHQDSDGTLVFNTTATPHQLGDVVKKFTNGTIEYHQRNGYKMKFNSDGRLEMLIDNNNNATILTYSGSKLIRISDSVGRSIELSYSQNRIVSITDPLSRTWQYSYDSSNRLIAVSDPLKQQTKYYYDTFSRLTSVIDRRGNIIKQIDYDSSGRVSQQKFSGASIERYFYSLSGNVVTGVSIVNSMNRTKSLRFNGFGQVIGTVKENGQETIIKRNFVGAQIEITGSCDCPHGQYNYDNNGNLISISDRRNKMGRYEYDSTYNKISKITNRLGNVTLFRYDLKGNLLSETNSKNNTINYSYNNAGQLISVTNALGQVTAYEYDSFANLISVAHPGGGRTSYERDAVGRITKISDALNRRLLIAYNDLNQITSITDAGNSTALREYDQNGNLIKNTNSLNSSWFYSYDDGNRLTLQTDPSGSFTKRSYNSLGELVSVRTSQGREVLYSYNSQGLPVLVKNVNNEQVKLEYNAQGSLIAFTDHNGSTTTYTYDELNRCVSMLDPHGRIAVYSYDDEGNLIKVVDRLGRQILFRYDELNRRKTVQYLDSLQNYYYDDTGRLVQVSDTQGGVINWSYDDAGKLITETTENGQVKYVYNLTGQRVALSSGDDYSVSYDYDSIGRLGQILVGQNKFKYSYDTFSRLVLLARSNSINTSYLYNKAGKLTRLEHYNAKNGLVVESLQYGRNSDGEIESILSQNMDTLLPETALNGTVDKASRLIKFGNNFFAYDSQGQLISKQGTAGVANYQWDTRGRLTKVITEAGIAIEYSYDALNRLVKRSAGGKTIRYLYDGNHVIKESGLDASAFYHVHGPGFDNKLLSYDNYTQKDYYLLNHLNSTIALTGQFENIANRISFDPYGDSNSQVEATYRYTGRDIDKGTGLYNYRNRWYYPQIGRFISEDPIRQKGGTNLYSYVANDPINFADPEGLQPTRFLESESLCDTAYAVLALANLASRFTNREYCGVICSEGGKYYPVMSNAAASGGGCVSNATCPAGDPVAHFHNHGRADYGGYSSFEQFSCTDENNTTLPTHFLGTPGFYPNYTPGYYQYPASTCPQFRDAILEPKPKPWWWSEGLKAPILGPY